MKASDYMLMRWVFWGLTALFAGVLVMSAIQDSSTGMIVGLAGMGLTTLLTCVWALLNL